MRSTDGRATGVLNALSSAFEASLAAAEM